MNFTVETSPHIRRKASIKSMLGDVLIALLPCIIFSCGYGWAGIKNLLIPLVVMEASELIFLLIKGKGKLTGYRASNALGAAVSAIIFGLMMEPRSAAIKGMEYFYLVAGSAFGIIVAKLLFGGFGQNIFNPAAAGFVFTKICFGASWSGVYAVNGWIGLFGLDTSLSTGATYLSSSPLIHSSSYSFLDLFLGNTAGAMGEVCKAAVLLGLAYMLIRRVADWRVVVSYGCTFALLCLLAGIFVRSGDNAFEFALYQILSGGMLFGVTFMITDPVTMPIDAPARVTYGMIAAILALFMRLFASNPEGVAYGILIANGVSAFLDHYKWAHSRYSWKDFLTYGIIATVAILIVCLASNSRSASLKEEELNEAASLILKGGK
jgi:Na+-translocating ferredoxin:NAD+ oxidoreductase subunit D